MKTESLVEWLRGYSLGLKESGGLVEAKFTLMAANRLERTDRSMRVARSERDRVREQLARANAQIEMLSDRVRELEGKDD